MKIFFDGGGDPGKTPDRIILAGIAANDDNWKDIEDNWLGILQLGNPKADYMHMNEAIQLKREFDPAKGWNETNVAELLNGGLLSYLTTLDKEKYCQFACTVDMAAYRKLLDENYQLEAPAGICLNSCVDRIMEWYFHEYHAACELESHYYFDQSEPFEDIFKARWTRELQSAERTGVPSRWHHVTHAGPVIMRKTPGLQVADMLAWAFNREAASPNKSYSTFAITLKALMATKWIEWDEDLLKKYYRPLIYKPYGQY